MSKTMNTPHTIHWQLLSTVSALALLASGYFAAKAEAAGNDTDRPQLWIEFGGDMDNITGQGDPFTPAFLAGNIASPNDPFLGFVPPSSYTYSTPDFSVLRKGTTPVQAQKPPLFSFGEEAKLSLQPEDSRWIFSAAIRFGRSGSVKEADHQTSAAFYGAYYKTGAAIPGNRHGIDNFADTQVHHSENHDILDFMAGKDVGLGMFGPNGASVLSGGVRIAQFTSGESFDIRARPDLQFKYQTGAPFGQPAKVLRLPFFQTNHATGLAKRSFRGVGPSVSWDGSASVAGDLQDGEATVDWGVNAALLFGKQRTFVRHHESEHYANPLFVLFGGYHTAYNNLVGGHSTSRTVTVSNLGGFADLSFRYADAKISLGYRADFFFGAMDGGIDARKSETLGFKGPFASISVGLGD